MPTTKIGMQEFGGLFAVYLQTPADPPHDRAARAVRAYLRARAGLMAELQAGVAGDRLTAQLDADGFNVLVTTEPST